ncbi:MAG: ATPase, T2SS/T4P/T4SS family [Lachnospiraceae bacterium]|nr:ATPase, T2SS/T4P/T4SS family [Lachnospiraceae bacterium]
MGSGNIKIRPEEQEAYFGLLYPYIQDQEITDIDYNGKAVWLTDCTNIRRMSDVRLDTDFVDQFTKRISNAVSKPFHKMSPVLEAETETLRITIVHESVCGSRCFCIRKSLPLVRLTEESAVSTGYVTRRMLNFLRNCVRARMNLVFAGNPGVGKTECAKFFSRYIPAKDRVITIEDNPEWHYGKVNPDKDCIEMKINPSMDYTRAIKTCLRLNPTWMFLSEARSLEVRYLLEGLSTGVRGMTTLHTDDVRNIPDRIVNMAGAGSESERIRNDTYSFLDVGILLKRKEVRDASGFVCVRRMIDQICFFLREKGENQILMVADKGEELDFRMTEGLRQRFLEYGISDPFSEDGKERTDFSSESYYGKRSDFEGSETVPYRRLRSEMDNAEAERKDFVGHALERAEAERLAGEKAEFERAEAERLAGEKAEFERAEAERIAREKAEAERAERESEERERVEKEAQIQLYLTEVSRELGMAAEGGTCHGRRSYQNTRAGSDANC